MVKCPLGPAGKLVSKTGVNVKTWSHTKQVLTQEFMCWNAGWMNHTFFFFLDSVVYNIIII